MFLCCFLSSYLPHMYESFEPWHLRDDYKVKKVHAHSPPLSKETTLPKTNSSHLKIGRNPIGKDRIPTIHFQGRTASFRIKTSFSIMLTTCSRNIHFSPTLTKGRKKIPGTLGTNSKSTWKLMLGRRSFTFPFWDLCFFFLAGANC